MVQNRNAEQFARLPEADGDSFVLRTGHGFAGGVVVTRHHEYRSGYDGGLEYLAAAVEEQDQEVLPDVVRQSAPQELSRPLLGRRIARR